MNTSIDIFKEKVELNAEKGSQETISHSGKEESAIVLGALFKYAQKSVKIYAGDFNGDISNNEYYARSVKEFLQNGKDLKVVVNELASIHSKVFQHISLYEGFKNNVELLHTNKGFSLGENKPVHFAIADNKAYRLEIDIIDYLGVACFNDQENAALLSKNFDLLCEHNNAINI